MKSFLMKPWKAQAIHESRPEREWQTRRIIKKPEQWMIDYDGEEHWFEDEYGIHHKLMEMCPYSVGDEVYIKETHRFLQGNGKPNDFGWAARTIVEITDIRAQQIQSISEDDAIAEGVQGDETYDQSTPRMCFEALWDSIHGEGAWERNEFVWVFSFKAIEEVR